MDIKPEFDPVCNGRLTQVEPSYSVVGRDGRRKHKAVFACSCGVHKEIVVGSVKSGNTLSCGCLVSDMLKRRNTTHGMCNTRAYTTWKGMWQRCTYKKHKDYKTYKDISVCAAWVDFTVFYNDVGDPPDDGRTLERIENNRGYEPDNVRWATAVEQGRNKKNNRRITANGETRTLSEWVEVTGIGRGAIVNRIRRGWSCEDAVFTPVGEPRGSRSRRPVEDQ